MIRAARTVSLFWVGLSALGVPASALPMAPEECERARSEQATLEGTGVAVDMARGPQWARDNLEPDRLKRIARWIDLQEQIQFRCPRPKPPPQSAAVTQPNDDGPGTAQKPQKPKPKSQATAETGDGASAPAKPKPKPERPKKPLIEDAYRPPAPFSGDELQHAVPGGSPSVPPATGLVP